MTQLTTDEVELALIAEGFLRDNYGMDLAIPVVRNNRLRTAMGRYRYSYDGTPLAIEIAGFMFEYAAPGVMVDTLKHECVHYAMHAKGDPHDDGHPHFEGELRRLGIGATGTCTVGTYVVYKCVECGEEARARGKRLLSDYKYRRTRCCDAKIEIVGERIYDGTEAV